MSNQPHSDPPAPTLDVDSFYNTCLVLLKEEREVTSPDIPPLNMYDLLWKATVSHAHALEIASRVFGALESDPLLVITRMANFVRKPTLPCKEDLYSLWCDWCTQHPEWPVEDTLPLPLYFSICQMNRLDCQLELRRRSRNLSVLYSTHGWDLQPVLTDQTRIA